VTEPLIVLEGSPGYYSRFAPPDFDCVWPETNVSSGDDET
jgi:hypothetical protein